MPTRREKVCQCVGGAGALVSCTGMIFSLVTGLAGAAGVGLIHQSDMAEMGSMANAGQAQAKISPLLSILNSIAIPLLLLSIVLMLIGVARAGWRTVGLVALGSAILLTNMFMRTSAAVAASLLAAGYIIVILGYIVAWRATPTRRATLPRA